MYQTRPALATGLLEHLDGFDFALAYHGDHTSLDHPRLFGRNFTNAGAEITLVIQIDRRDGRGQRCHHVGGVEAATETHLEERQLHAGAPKQAKRDGGRGLEKRRVRRQCAASSELVDRIADDRRLPPKLVRQDGTPIDHEPFLEGD